ncbi:MAG: T9SS type A sorting domain-containing protein [Bacteroidales bacterium]|nr:T9SS type A sorting domain-containing protein [Bacteroidales bacterium]
MSNQETVLVSNLSAGIYLYNIITNKEKYTGKLIIKNE